MNKLSLPTRVLGRTNFKVSSLGLGCAGLGHVYGDVAYRDGYNMVHGALNNGVNILDTAPYYGVTKSEANLGKILSEIHCNTDIKRNDYYLCSKVGRYDTDVFDHSPSRIDSSIEESLNRLETDYLDVCHFHDIEFSDNISMIYNESIPYLIEEYKNKRGIIKAVGISGRPLNVLDYTIHKLHETYGYDKYNIDTIITYNNYGLFDNRLLMYIERWVNKYNIGIIQGGTTFLGILTPQGPPEWNDGPPMVKEKSKYVINELLPKLYEKYDDSNGENQTRIKYGNSKDNICRLSFLYCHNLQSISTCLVGGTNISQINRNVEWLTDNNINSSQNTQDHLTEIDKKVLNDLQNGEFADIMNIGWVEKGSEKNVVKALLDYWK